MSGASDVLEKPYPALMDWLKANHVEFEVHAHPTTYTARETARAEHVSPAAFAKAIGVITDDGRRALFVLDAADHVDLHKARALLGAAHVRLMTEGELAESFPGCEVGATPAVGAIFGLPMHVDYALRDIPAFTFQAGSHQFSIHLDRPSWEKAARVTYEGLAEHREVEPAWMRS